MRTELTARCLGVLLLATVGSSAVQAQTDGAPCDRTKSLSDCWDAQTAIIADAVRNTGVQVEKKSSASTDPGSSTSMLNLLPSLFGALGIDGLTNTAGNLNLDKVFTPTGHWRLDLGATVYGGADLFEPLVKALPESVRSDVQADLKDQIGDFDKSDLQLRLAPGWTARQGAWRWIGRDPEAYSQLVGEWYSSAIAEAFRGDDFRAWRVDSVEPIDEEWEAIAGESEKGLAEVPINQIISDFGARGPAVVSRLEGDLVLRARAFKKSLAAVDGPMGRVDDLIANQPQLILEGSYHERRNLTGVDEWSGKLSYEIGLFGNLNDLRTWARGHAGKCGTPKWPSYDCLQAYLSAQKGKQKAQSDSGNRLAISLEYSHTDPLHFTLPDQDFTFDLGSSQTWAGSLTYGRYLEIFKLPNLLGALHGGQVVLEDSARFDLEAKYDDASGDPMKQSRFTATATFSQKASDNSTYSLSLAYANKPEYLGEVSHELSANLGLKWSHDKQSGQ